MWWIIGVLGIALVTFLLVSAFPQHPKRRTHLHDFERHDSTEQFYRY